MNKELKQWIQSQHSDHLVCRDMGHRWRLIDVQRTGSGFDRMFQCDNCTSSKVQELNSKGYYIKSRMSYDSDYLRPKGSGRITRDENAAIRLTNINGSKP